MSYDLDEDILQDFLVEAGEILDLLSEQLVELENNPDDADLLNAIFRGFHTVKGGAGFLALNELVETCHGAENVFDILRTGKRQVTSSLMDTMLTALDTINSQFIAVKNSHVVSPAPAHLLSELHRLSKSEPTLNDPVDVTPLTEINRNPVNTTITASSIDSISQAEFDNLLDELHGANASTTSILQEESSVVVNETEFHGEINDDSLINSDITDDEFEKLLDELHGKGGAPGQQTAEPTVNITSDIVAVSTASDEISDDEFEKLLDQLHGKGHGPSGAAVKESADTLDLADSMTDDLISDDEFERLLDELHGTGQAPTASSTSISSDSSTISAGSMTFQPVVESSSSHSEKVNQANTADFSPVSQTTKTKEWVKEPELSHQKVKSENNKKTSNKKANSDTTVRVDTSTLDTIMNMVGELVLVRNRLVSLGLNKDDEEMSKAVANLDVVTADLQGAVMKTRMQPIKKVFGRFPRVVRDLARNLEKDIVLEMRGEETDLDKNLVEALADPLIHLVRNSVDHGIEMPQERLQAGKSSTGTVILSASQEGDHIELAIIDDGKGMDPNKLRSIAIKRGVMDEDSAARLSNKECFNLIFAPGFSSKDEISNISGRGVGMDVVNTAINALNGSIDIDSEAGKGTKITIKVPLTLAILPTLMVGVAGHPYALPLASVNEIFHLDLSKTNMVDGQLAVIVREKAIPLFYLQNWLGADDHQVQIRQGYGHVVIVQIGSQRVGFVVDSLIGQEEVVIKPLDKLLQGTPGMAGATITSDGHIALILDVPDLLKQYA